jgi:hypothetical protein
MNTTAIYVRRLAPYGLAMLLGACDQGPSTVMPDAEFRLTAFPLPNRTHLSVGINSVFDHSMSTPYCPDDRVVAFTGETGNGQQKKILASFGCGDLYGFVAGRRR